MAKVSAGLLMYRRRGEQLEVFLAHPGGPFFSNKDEGSWTVPKGEIEGSDTPLATAVREFEEETGIQPAGELLSLGQVKQKGGKVVHAWAFQGDVVPGQPLSSNTFTMQWPPGSGVFASFPEIDRAEFFSIDVAKQKINAAQVAFIDRLVDKLAKLNTST